MNWLLYWALIHNQENDYNIHGKVDLKDSQFKYILLLFIITIIIKKKKN